MITWLSNIFDSISGFFQSISNGISSIISKLVEFFQLVTEFFEFLYNAIQLVPIYYQIFGSIIITVLIIMLILGRESGGDS